MITALLVASSLAGDAPREAMPARHWDIQHLDLALRVEPGGTISGTATHTITPLGKPHPWLALDQTGLEIKAVSVDGTPTNRWKQGDTRIEVGVPTDGASHTVAITYAATPQTGLHFRGQRGSSDSMQEVWSQGENTDNRHWFPTWDHPSDLFTVSQAYTVPAGWVAFGNGLTVDVEPAEPGWSTHRFRLEQPIVSYLVMLAAGEYEVFEDDRARVPLLYAVPRGVGEDTARRTLGSTPEQLAWFEQLLGTPYPYPEYRQIVAQRFMYGGMENASSTILSDRLLLPTDDTPFYGTESVVAHELAHQWFGDLLTCYGWRELWLNEGFATYYAWRWLEHREGAQWAAGNLRGNQQAALHDKRPMAARGWSKVGSSDYTAQYVRGMSVLYMVEKLIGRATFDQAIATYVHENQHRLVESADLRRVLEDASGEHLGWLFDQYVYQYRIPELSTRWSWDDGTLEVVPTPVLPEDDPQPRHTFVDIEVGTPAGVVERRVWVGETAAHWVLDMPEEPRWVSVNHDGGALARWQHEQPVTAWAAQLQHSPSAFARWEAVEHLEEDAEAVPALLAILTADETHPTLRQRVATALGRLGDPTGLDALVDLASAPEAITRRAAAAGLGESPPTEAVVRALGRLCRDGSPDVRAAALRGLSSTEAAQAVVLARSALSTPDPTPYQAVHSAAARILGSDGALGDVSRLLALTAARHPRNTRHSAAYAAVELLREDEAFDKDGHAGASRALERFLDDPDLRTRQVGVSLLAKVGDAASARRLTAFAAANLVPGLSQSARDSASRIRSRQPDAPPTPPEDNQRLDERLRALEERIEDLERWR